MVCVGLRIRFGTLQLRIPHANSLLFDRLQCQAFNIAFADWQQHHLHHKLQRLCFDLLRTLDKLDIIIKEVDAGYEELAEMQAEGQTVGFCEEFLGSILTIHRCENMISYFSCIQEI